MDIAAILSLGALAIQTATQMIADGRTTTTAEEQQALTDSVARQKVADDQFDSLTGAAGGQ